MFQKENLSSQSVLGCLQAGRETKEFNDICVKCGQVITEIRFIEQSRFQSWNDIPPGMPESVKADLEKPNACLLLIRKPQDKAEVVTLLVHIVPGHKNKN